MKISQKQACINDFEKKYFDEKGKRQISWNEYADLKAKFDKDFVVAQLIFNETYTGDPNTRRDDISVRELFYFDADKYADAYSIHEELVRMEKGISDHKYHPHPAIFQNAEYPWSDVAYKHGNNTGTISSCRPQKLKCW